VCGALLTIDDLQIGVRKILVVPTTSFHFHGVCKNTLLPQTVSGSAFVSKRAVFFRYSTTKMSWPWNPDQRSLKVIGTDTDRSATYDFLSSY